MRISDWSSDVCSSDLAQASGHLANIFVLRGEKTQIRSSKLQPHTDGLSFPHHDVSAHFARSSDGTYSHWFCHNGDQQGSNFMSLSCNGIQVLDTAQYIRILNNNAACILVTPIHQRRNVSLAFKPPPLQDQVA